MELSERRMYDDAVVEGVGGRSLPTGRRGEMDVTPLGSEEVQGPKGVRMGSVGWCQIE
jgi:hypothetical protein